MQNMELVLEKIRNLDQKFGIFMTQNAAQHKSTRDLQKEINERLTVVEKAKTYTFGMIIGGSSVITIIWTIITFFK